LTAVTPPNFFGIILVVVMIFMPEGLTGGLLYWWSRRSRSLIKADDQQEGKIASAD